ncbi:MULTISPECIES: ABC transporter ATP-binding protein [Aminobacter]|jgi:branched-chain amino acid transport system ATP-binding protein|uniref:Branched-chain amino acid ABC transporter ATPase n=2 Tax=Aminobacter TaxID=31988 RepID=A0AAC8YVZ2_AMIAI|nr:MULTISPECIES: ABC transporter ATP-binding protein [Aminobacter]AMS44796.1 branched-chain amino acid ABC transporter ATPase [Aminobacter aminovorans]MBA8908135.1 branched-chain amino acid transport system ATP-binding protein [Aminobacter ciceronei]MBA9021881.1 branched-chain amino acid transport system ATP-binding protein [Aminobacter ciceronei]MBB3704410.1 branched-chain amino acid transport system ATP-binding protein [Aminobacter aminovorans]MRX32351.1 ATP-binding cassette domain-containin
MIRLHSVDKSYGALKVLHGIEAEILEGETFAIIGPNGAGKTTLFKVMTGEVGCEAGTVEFLGKDVTKEPAYRRTRAGMGRTFQMARIFKEMTAEENIVVAIEARAKNMGQRDTPWYQVRPSRATVDEAGEILARLSLERKARIAAAQLSHGDKKRLELGITLAGRPKVLMLDEPTAGMSPSERVGVTELIRSISGKGSGLTVIMTEHDMGVIFGLADRIMVMNQGRKIAEGSIDDIRADPVVRDVYLGKEAHHA